jgi:hypothetical protein
MMKLAPNYSGNFGTIEISYYNYCQYPMHLLVPPKLHLNRCFILNQPYFSSITEYVLMYERVFLLNCDRSTTEKLF